MSDRIFGDEIIDPSNFVEETISLLKQLDFEGNAEGESIRLWDHLNLHNDTINTKITKLNALYHSSDLFRVNEISKYYLYYCLGAIFSRLDKPKNAFQANMSAYNLKSTSPILTRRIAINLYAIGVYDEALDYLKTTLRLTKIYDKKQMEIRFPTYDDALNDYASYYTGMWYGGIYFDLGKIYLSKGDTRQAKIHFEHSFEYMDGNPAGVLANYIRCIFHIIYCDLIIHDEIKQTQSFVQLLGKIYESKGEYVNKYSPTHTHEQNIDRITFFYHLTEAVRLSYRNTMQDKASAKSKFENIKSKFPFNEQYEEKISVDRMYFSEFVLLMKPYLRILIQEYNAFPNDELLTTIKKLIQEVQEKAILNSFLRIFADFAILEANLHVSKFEFNKSLEILQNLKLFAKEQRLSSLNLIIEQEISLVYQEIDRMKELIEKNINASNTTDRILNYLEYALDLTENT